MIIISKYGVIKSNIKAKTAVFTGGDAIRNKTIISNKLIEQINNYNTLGCLLYATERYVTNKLAESFADNCSHQSSYKTFRNPATNQTANIDLQNVSHSHTATRRETGTLIEQVKFRIKAEDIQFFLENPQSTHSSTTEKL
jgi:hypothetical protein